MCCWSEDNLNDGVNADLIRERCGGKRCDDAYYIVEPSRASVDGPSNELRAWLAETERRSRWDEDEIARMRARALRASAQWPVSLCLEVLDRTILTELAR